MLGSQEAVMTEHAGWLHEPGYTLYRLFVDAVNSGSYYLSDRSFQDASVFTDKKEMCDSSFVQALRTKVRIASKGTDSSGPGDQDNWINIGSTVTRWRRSTLSPDALARN